MIPCNFQQVSNGAKHMVPRESKCCVKQRVMRLPKNEIVSPKSTHLTAFLKLSIKGFFEIVGGSANELLVDCELFAFRTNINGHHLVAKVARIAVSHMVILL
jgi:hypothetical protein